VGGGCLVGIWGFYVFRWAFWVVNTGFGGKCIFWVKRMSWVWSSGVVSLGLCVGFVYCWDLVMNELSPKI